MKVGDFVKVLDKTVGSIGLPFFSWNKGDIGYVTAISNHAEGKAYWLSKSLNGEERNAGFRREDLELIEDKIDWSKFKIGDKVKAIGKSISGFGWNESWKYGNIGYVYRTDRLLSDGISDGIRCIEVSKEKDKYWNSGFFNPEDLELIKETKYVKGEKSLKITDVLAAFEPSQEEKRNFSYNMIHQKKYDYTDVIEIDDWFIEYVLDRDGCFIEWLLYEGYVKKYVEEKKKKEFEPFNLTLEIRSEDELKSIWHRFNFVTRDINFTEYDRNTHTLPGKAEDFISSRADMRRLWKKVDDKLRDLNLK